MLSRIFLASLSAVILLHAADTTSAGPNDLTRLGHSHLGDAFDTGPREKPWVMQGIGVAHFSITTKNPEVQRWFDQGNALLHSFAYYEAERSFRWCLKLEPENAMAYWGLARAINGDRGKDMMREALKRRDAVSDREKLYIDYLAAQMLPDPLRTGEKPETYEQTQRRAAKFLETLCVKYPADMEARALLALEKMGDDRYGAELIIREILAKQPDHPGAHHYRIHNWDYHEPEQALVSAKRYGEIVPGIGHALHMPGHIYSIVGMWNEAAISMDSATRSEKQYMIDTLTFPFNNWNYGHNRNYLSYIQEQLGMFNAAIFGARQLIDVPLDPKLNNDTPFSYISYGIASLSRGLLKAERYDDILKPDTIPWRDILLDKVNRAYFEARARIAKGDLAKANKAVSDHQGLKADLDKDKENFANRYYAIQALELKGRLAILRGDNLAGLGWLAEAAQMQYDFQLTYADPPFYPQALYNSLGEEYLKLKSPMLAAQSFEKSLTLTKNDLFALSGLVRSYAALGEKTKAQDAMARLLFVTADADPNLAIVERAKATGITATPRDSSPAPQRNYVRTSLEKFGPNRWDPYPAPDLDATDSAGKHVSLADYRGKNVILVFYLGSECAHCVDQLHKLAAKKTDWELSNTVLLAISSAAPDKNAADLKTMGELPIRLLSDNRYANAHRFHSYDDFEDMELHSTILIDKLGRVYWAQTGGSPFSDIEFLSKQITRMNQLTSAAPVTAASATPAKPAL